MKPLARSATGFAIATALILVPCAAWAQTAMSGPSITQGLQTAPERYLHYGQANAQDLGTSTRPQGLNPTGINYSDCISDMTLGFPVVLTGFGVGNTDGMQIWASTNGTCISNPDRGVGGPPVCWLVNNGLPLGQVFTGSTTYFIRVQDIVGPQQAPPNPPLLVNEGASACSAQPSYAAVPITLWFVPLSSEGEYDTNATALEWTLTTDLVGPPAPRGLNVGAGDKLLTASWTANADSDTYGYDVFIDPPPGSPVQMAATTEVVCADSGGTGSTGADSSSGSTSSGGDGSSGSSGGDGSSEAGSEMEGGSVEDADDDTETESSTSSSSASSSSSTTSTSSSSTAGGGGAAADAACHTVNVGQSGSASGCSSAVLASASVQDSGVSTTSEDDVDAGGEDAAALDSGTASEPGGIATIPCQYGLSVGCASGSPVYTAQRTTLTGESNTTYTITDLIDGVTYVVAVTAVDNSGNPGPPSAQSPETCNYPAPVNDFYALYRGAGGLAGGGFCSLGQGKELDASSGASVGLSIALGTAGTAALAVGRRRRRRGRRA